MKALELYKYIKDNDIEWHWTVNDDGDKYVIILPHNFEIEAFCSLFDYKDDDPFVFHFKGTHFAIYMADICEYYDIDINEIFEKA